MIKVDVTWTCDESGCTNTATGKAVVTHDGGIINSEQPTGWRYVYNADFYKPAQTLCPTHIDGASITACPNAVPATAGERYQPW